ncbi:hypothetical protein LXA43DRAFT_1184078 [Ganoderma leucocontextum]|nr:hypothetical protein LXA43DRAFT_1184078 [Ganoderma leucocontextum]
MPSIPSEPYGSGVAVLNGLPHADLAPPPAPLRVEQNQLPNLSNFTLLQPLPRLGSRPSSPAPSLPYVDLPTTCCASDITCHSPTITTSKPAVAENTVRLTPISCHPNHPALGMSIFFCDPSQLFLLQSSDRREARVTMGEVLRRYSTQIASIDLNATGVPNPAAAETMACAVKLPFSPDAVEFEGETYPQLCDRYFPVLSALEDLNITTSRAPSICTLLNFLQYTPLLKNLSITNHRDHQAVLPDDVAKVAAPNLPHLHHVSVDGLLTNTVEQLLHKLLPSIKPRTVLDVHFHTPSFPAFNHDAVMNALFAPVRHVNLAYIALSNREPPPCAHTPEHEPKTGARGRATSSYLFSLSDATGRVTLTWHWAEEPGARPYLGHIGLATRALARVRTVALALYNVRPSAADLHQVLQSFSALARVEVYATQSQSDSELGPVASQHGTFRLRAAPVVRRLADVPTLFALGLAQRCVSPSAAGSGLGLQVAGALPRATGYERGGLSRLARMWYRPLWAVMVRKPLSA